MCEASYRIVPLVEADGLMLLIPNGLSEDNFVPTFQKAWSRIPKADRNLMKQFWDAKPPARSGRKYPVIQLYQTDQELGTSDGLAVAYNNPGIIFARQQGGEELAQSIVAHEIAHCFQAATGSNDGKNAEEVEVDADVIVRKWGFDVEYRFYMTWCIEGNPCGSFRAYMDSKSRQQSPPLAAS